MDKSPDAFRTISEVAEHLETPAHVLRFWESRFPQIRPVKRAGGRRYYRPGDVALLTGIKRLLHEEGLTIRGVQKILREQGVRHVAGLAGVPLPEDADIDAEAALEAALAVNFGLLDEEPITPDVAETATVVALETALRKPPQTATTLNSEPADIATPVGRPSAADATPSLFDVLGPAEPVLPAAQPSESVFLPPYSISLPDLVQLAPDAVDDEEESPRVVLPGLVQRLQALPRAALPADPAAWRALHQRLAALHARLTGSL